MIAGRRVEARRGVFVRLVGPLRVRVEKGRLDFGGFEAGEGFEAVVQASRGVSALAIEDTVLGVQGPGRVDVFESSVLGGVWRAWRRVLDEVARGGYRRVAVLGPVESGKSTLSAWMASRMRWCYASLDPGQNELGTPCFYSAAPVEEPVLSVKDLGARWAWLVGCTTPSHCHWSSVSAASRLAGFTRRACRGVVLDTDGFVSGPGLLYKQALLDALSPDAVVVFEKGPWRGLAQLSRGVADAVYTVPPVPEEYVVERSRGDRRVFRERMYARLFSSPVTLDLPLDAVAILGADYGGLPEPRLPGLHLDASGNVVKPRQAPRGLIAGLTLREGYDVPALLKSIDWGLARLTVAAAWEPRGEVRAVRLGFVRLLEGWREERLGYSPVRL